MYDVPILGGRQVFQLYIYICDIIAPPHNTKQSVQSVLVGHVL